MCKYDITSCLSTDSQSDDIDLVMEMTRRERRLNLVNDLRKIFSRAVLPLAQKVLKMEAGSELFLDEGTLNLIITDIIELGEREPYGVHGGTLVVNFLNNSNLIRIGKFAINSNSIPTFELRLTLTSSTNILNKVANLMKRMQARPPQMFVDEKYQLEKLKIYQLL